MVFVFRRGHCIVTVTYCSVTWARLSLARIHETLSAVRSDALPTYLCRCWHLVFAMIPEQVCLVSRQYLPLIVIVDKTDWKRRYDHAPCCLSRLVTACSFFAAKIAT